ncbi:TonB-dependent receptor plug domain-containing protein [Mucilaginibacter sp.]|uniref:TonB-dependent receptor plug domain-containing protein n=1 Tax=Mucilaginibacter sp. TaxID=1882438 RepID=UPI003D152D20
MKKSISLLTFLSFILLPHLAVYAQTANISAKLKAYTTDHNIEKAYLQFDKPFYITGDTIYYKAYVTLGTGHKLSALSGILHADLIGPDNKISQSVKLQIIAGTAWGDFVLPDTLKGGSYRVRAYTNYMRNEGDDSFFEQTIPIGSAKAIVKKIPESGEPNKFKIDVKTVNRKTDVQFLPEGGSLIVGNYSKIAFKAVGADGSGAEVKGTITDDTGVEVCTFASTHLGMGAFDLVPESGKTYQAHIVYADGSKGTIDLPKAIATGYTISVNNTGADTLRIRVTGGSGTSLNKLSLVAQAGGTIYYQAENQSDYKFFSVLIPKTTFPTGIMQLTLFNEAGEPLNERLVFINNNDQLKLSVSSKDVYAPRQKQNIAFSITDKNNQPVTGSFSVAVTDETIVTPDTLNENNILSNLLLTSDLKGSVEQPDYYFSHITDKTNADLDLLMLTQGYRHFEWKQALSNNPPIIYQPEKTMEISGTVKKGSNVLPNAKVTLFTKSGGGLLRDTLTDASGRFAFKDLVFADSTKFVVQSKVAKGQDAVTLELDTVLAPQVIPQNRYRSLAKTTQNADMAAYVINQKQFYQEQQKYGINKHALVLKEVHIEAKKEPLIPHSENLNGSGNADQVITAKELEISGYTNLYDAVRAKANFISFTKDHKIISGHAVPSFTGPDLMEIIVDGLPMQQSANPNPLEELNAADIEGVEIGLGAHYGAIYGSRAAGGFIIVTTKRAQKQNNYYRYAPGVITYMPKGFYKAREFYSPQYDNPKTNQKMADLRSTIYWQPNIITDNEGKASFSFFNADGKGTYRVVIEGIDTDGNLGRQVFRYKVE